MIRQDRCAGSRPAAANLARPPARAASALREPPGGGPARALDRNASIGSRPERIAPRASPWRCDGVISAARVLNSFACLARAILGPQRPGICRSCNTYLLA